MNEKLQFPVTDADTLLPFLRGCFKAKSRNYVKGILARGQVYIDGKAETHYARELRPGQIVEVRMGAAAAETGPAFPIIYEDDNIVVIDKPHGMLSISTDKESERTAYHLITDYVKSRNGASRVFIVHRLDRDTSGVMLFAKNERMKTLLQDEWDELVTRRGYTAVVEGEPPEGEGQIVSWLKQTRTLLVYSSDRSGDGKKAVTNYTVLQSGGGYSLLDVTLETGRKNQIRVHMSDMGNPVAGDKKYGAKTDPLKRLGLHASELALINPITGEAMVFKSKVPPAFSRLCADAETK